MDQKPKIAVHKFTSCDGCQLAFLNAGEDLLTLSHLVDILHFAEFGKVNPESVVDIAFVEGSISTAAQLEQIKLIRKNSRYVITIGACATAGGIQALRNFADKDAWMSAIYATPDYIETLKTSTAIANHIIVDWELWGCPVNTKQVMTVIRSLLSGATPSIAKNPVCMECKRAGHECVLVINNKPCLGPVTSEGCGALCPSVGRACYGCYGPSDNPNVKALGDWFLQQGVETKKSLVKQFSHINSQAKSFNVAATHFKGIKIVDEK